MFRPTSLPACDEVIALHVDLPVIVTYCLTPLTSQPSFLTLYDPSVSSPTEEGPITHKIPTSPLKQVVMSDTIVSFLELCTDQCGGDVASLLSTLAIRDM